MPKIELRDVPVLSGTGYPQPYAALVKGRSRQALGDAVGLTQFGVNLVRLEPGAASSQRHWHENEDEFLIMVEGELTLVDESGATAMRPGDCAGFKAGDPNGHHLVNRSDRPGVFLVVGTRAGLDRTHYPDIDMVYVRDESGGRFTRRSGEPY
jgi:uncharacterized cupin superfamily protein